MRSVRVDGAGCVAVIEGYEGDGPRGMRGAIRLQLPGQQMVQVEGIAEHLETLVDVLGRALIAAGWKGAHRG